MLEKGSIRMITISVQEGLSYGTISGFRNDFAELFISFTSLLVEEYWTTQRMLVAHGHYFREISKMTDDSVVQCLRFEGGENLFIFS